LAADRLHQGKFDNLPTSFSSNWTVESKMPSESKKFQQDLLESVRQMRHGQAARVTKVKLLPAAEARAKTGLSQEEFARLLGVSARTLQDWEQGRRQPTGAAKTLLRLATQRPEVLLELDAWRSWGSFEVTRSLVPLTVDDLIRLGRRAAEDRAAFFGRKPDTAALYSSRLFAVALCQGAAMHYIDGKNGVKDFDVWSFFSESPIRMFPPRRRGEADFGDPKFGVSSDAPSFVGRRVDLIGRSIPDANPSDPVGTLRRYLGHVRTKSARLLALKAVVLIEPTELLSTVVWPAQWCLAR
jgi:DNA-binding transcriptional regulator YiaG